MSRIAILGGSFNPPHLGHQLICTWALGTAQADAVWLLPVFRHAFDKPLAPFEHRLAMCRLTAAPFASGAVESCAIEAELCAPSRTLVTVQHLMARHPEHRFSLLLGADLLRETQDWYRFDELQRLVPLVVIGRAGHVAPDASLALASVSSTEVRWRLARGLEVEHLVPRAVCDYIREHRLYRDDRTEVGQGRPW